LAARGGRVRRLYIYIYNMQYAKCKRVSVLDLEAVEAKLHIADNQNQIAKNSFFCKKEGYAFPIPTHMVLGVS
jgi:hypothetical protein